LLLYVNILQTGEQIIGTVKYVDGLVLLAKKEKKLYGMLVGDEKHCGIGMNVEEGGGGTSNENFDTAISWRT
jgi:hypothetical protein